MKFAGCAVIQIHVVFSKPLPVDPSIHRTRPTGRIAATCFIKGAHHAFAIQSCGTSQIDGFGHLHAAIRIGRALARL
jgi:hypothetical protein